MKDDIQKIYKFAAKVLTLLIPAYFITGILTVLSILHPQINLFLAKSPAAHYALIPVLLSVIPQTILFVMKFE